MKRLVRLLVVVLIAIVAINYFTGNDQERETSEKIVEEVKDLGRAIGDLVRAEKAKYNKGEYDDLLNRIGIMLNTVKEKSKGYRFGYI